MGVNKKYKELGGCRRECVAGMPSERGVDGLFVNEIYDPRTKGATSVWPAQHLALTKMVHDLERPAGGRRKGRSNCLYWPGRAAKWNRNRWTCELSISGADSTRECSPPRGCVICIEKWFLPLSLSSLPHWDWWAPISCEGTWEDMAGSIATLLRSVSADTNACSQAGKGQAAQSHPSTPPTHTHTRTHTRIRKHTQVFLIAANMLTNGSLFCFARWLRPFLFFRLRRMIQHHSEHSGAILYTVLPPHIAAKPNGSYQ